MPRPKVRRVCERCDAPRAEAVTATFKIGRPHVWPKKVLLSLVIYLCPECMIDIRLRTDCFRSIFNGEADVPDPK